MVVALPLVFRPVFHPATNHKLLKKAGQTDAYLNSGFTY